MDFIQKVLEATLSKRKNEAAIEEEYDALEQVPPAPGSSWDQHAKMVKHGLCEEACKNEPKNR